jgi:hypothetical protein
MEIPSSIAGLILVSLPFVFVVLAWRSARRNTKLQVLWRKRLFTVALIGAAAGYAWFWIVFLFLPSRLPFEVYRLIGWVSGGLAVTFAALSFSGSGPARIFAFLATTGVAVLWATIGFW